LRIAWLRKGLVGGPDGSPRGTIHAGKYEPTIVCRAVPPIGKASRVQIGAPKQVIYVPAVDEVSQTLELAHGFQPCGAPPGEPN
jgi:hypothetical protein